MAYKFQLGAARMSGALEQEGDISLATGSGADVIGIESSLGSGQYLAQLGYDASTSTGKLEIADGSSGGTVFSVLDVLSGSAMDTLAGSGLAFNQGSGVMSLDIDELSALGGASLNQTQDFFAFSDNGTEKKISFTNLEDSIFGNVSGDALIAAGGALTIQAGAVNGSMLNTDAISAQTAMTGDLDDTDELFVSDGGTLKRADFSVVRDAVFNDVSSQASVAAGGALSLTVAAVSGQTDLGGASLAQADEFLLNDGGVIKKVNFSDFEDSIFGNVTGDVTVAAGGASTIAAAAVHHGMLNDDIISGQSELAHADIQDADDLMIHDATAGAVLKVGVDSLRDHYFGVVSGDVTIADGGAATMNPAQTNITSLLATDIKIGEDDQTKIDFETPDEIHFYAANTEQVYVASGKFAPETDGAVDLGTSTERFADAYVDSLTVTNNVTIAGNLTVTGATTEIQQAFVVTSSVQFEGITPDGNEISLTSADPTADRTITLPDLDGHVPLLAGAISNANVTAVEFALLDGGSSVGTTAVATGDGFLHNDGGTMRVTQIDKIIDASAGNGLSASGVELSFDLGGMPSRTVVAQGDIIAIGANNDSNNAKQISFTNFEDQIFGNVSSQASIAAGGALSLTVAAVSGQTDLGGASVAQADEFLLNDGGVIKKVNFSDLEDSVFGNISSQASVAAGGALSLNVAAITGQADIGAAIVATDEMMISDGGVLKRTDMSRVATYVGENLAEKIDSISSNETLLNFSGGKILLVDSTSGDVTVILPAAVNHAGEIVKIKKNADANNVTIDANSSETIDGSTTIILESPRSAVQLICDGSNWHVM